MAAVRCAPLGCGCDVVAVAGVPGVDPPARLGVDWPLWVRCSIPLKYALCALFSAFSARFSAFFALFSANGIFFHIFTRPVLCPIGGRFVALFGRWFVAVLVAAAPYLPAVAVPGSWL